MAAACALRAPPAGAAPPARARSGCCPLPARMVSCPAAPRQGPGPEPCAILTAGYGGERTQPMIQVDHLTKHYGPVTAIEDVSFGVEKGKIVGFLGPNGAGKSTAMRILSCFMPASGGTARIAGFDVFSQSMEVRRRIGYLPENAPLYPDLPAAG